MGTVASLIGQLGWGPLTVIGNSTAAVFGFIDTFVDPRIQARKVFYDNPHLASLFLENTELLEELCPHEADLVMAAARKATTQGHLAFRWHIHGIKWGQTIIKTVLLASMLFPLMTIYSQGIILTACVVSIPIAGRLIELILTALPWEAPFKVMAYFNDVIVHKCLSLSVFVGLLVNNYFSSGLNELPGLDIGLHTTAMLALAMLSGRVRTTTLDEHLPLYAEAIRTGNLLGDLEADSKHILSLPVLKQLSMRCQKGVQLAEKEELEDLSKYWKKQASKVNMWLQRRRAKDTKFLFERIEFGKVHALPLTEVASLLRCVKLIGQDLPSKVNYTAQILLGKLADGSHPQLIQEGEAALQSPHLAPALRKPLEERLGHLAALQEPVRTRTARTKADEGTTQKQAKDLIRNVDSSLPLAERIALYKKAAEALKLPLAQHCEELRAEGLDELFETLEDKIDAEEDFTVEKIELLLNAELGLLLFVLEPVYNQADPAEFEWQSCNRLENAKLRLAQKALKALAKPAKEVSDILNLEQTLLAKINGNKLAFEAFWQILTKSPLFWNTLFAAQVKRAKAL